MSYVQRQAAHCDQCSHEWLVVGASTPTHCAKCKSRRWNGGAVVQSDRALVRPATPETVSSVPGAVGSIPTATTKLTQQLEASQPSSRLDSIDISGWPTEKQAVDHEKKMQALRDICAGKVAGVGVLEREEQVPTTTVPAEIPICGNTWWEDGEHYECLMDKGHKFPKHGVSGMVRRLEQ